MVDVRTQGADTFTRVSDYSSVRRVSAEARKGRQGRPREAAGTV